MFPRWAQTLNLFYIAAITCQEVTVYTVDSLQMANMSNKLHYSMVELALN